MAKTATRELEIEEDRDEVDTDSKDKRNDTSMLVENDEQEEFDEGPDNAEARRQVDRLSQPGDDDEYDDDPPQRESRRRRRNRSNREARNADRGKIAVLEAQIGQLSGMLQQQQRGQMALYAQDIEGQISQLTGYLNDIDAAMSKAIKEQDDETFRRARTLERETQTRLTALHATRARIVAAVETRQDAAPPPVQNQPDPRAIQLSRQFMRDNPWFDPNDATDEDSNIVKAIDASLTNEGYAHDSEEFWDELQRRVDARGLGDEDNMQYDDEDFYEPRRDRSRDKETPRRQARRDSGGLPPRSGRGGTGRRPGGSGTFKLTPDMVEALEAEGLAETKGLDKTQLEYRRRLVDTWRKGITDAKKAGKL